jgi:hypothetical protein
MEFCLVAKHAQGGAQIIGLQTARVERAALHEVASVDLLALALHDVGDAAVGGGDVTARLPLAYAPIVLGGILPHVVVLGAGQDQLHDLVDAAFQLGLIGSGHGRLLSGRPGRGASCPPGVPLDAAGLFVP